MTPKEQAERLYEKFYKRIPTRLMHYDTHRKLAKNLAIDCVDEIIQDNIDTFISDEKNYEHTNAYKFWENVKLELKKD